MAKADKSDWRAGTAVRVRMYRHGLGDCFLLSFPRADKPDYQVLIDCGLILGTPNADVLIGEVIADLGKETGHRLDVLVATHEHWDHLSGFADPDAFAKFKIGAVWMAWTEDPKDKIANEIREERGEQLNALRLGVAGLRAELAATGALGADDSGPAADEYRRVSAVLAFFGPEGDAAPGALGAGSGRRTIAAAMNWCRDRPDEHREFWRPGKVIDLTKEVGGLRAYVLGPPTDRKQLFKDLPTKRGRETYEHEHAAHGLAAAGRAFFGADVGQPGGDCARAEFERGAPFDQKYRIDVTAATDIDFFRTHYFGTGPDDADGWRRIDGAGLDGAARFALKLDSDTNNTSLVLAFELGDDRVLLFPGDAQVGNWESWHDDGKGNKLTWKVGNKEVTVEELLARTVLYKVGHHGSHNATLRAKGLELMTDDRLIALVPVDTYVAHEKKGWDQMPFEPLTAALRRKAGRRVVFADEPVGSVNWGERVGRAEDAKESTIDVETTGKKTVARPLYVDVFLPAS